MAGQPDKADTAVSVFVVMCEHVNVYCMDGGAPCVRGVCVHDTMKRDTVMCCVWMLAGILAATR